METKNSGGRKILIIEDEASISDVCRRVLTREGFEVDIAVNGKLAQDMVLRKQYDLCLIDIRTPDMNGMEFYEWLEQEHLQLTRGVIFTTGSMLEGTINRFLEVAGRPFLPKPFSPDDLKAVVKKTLQE